jgi:rod shape-determining protein MreC
MNFLHQHKKIVIICLALLSFVLMAYTARENYRPGPVERGFGFAITNVQGFFMNIGDWFSDRIDFLVNMNELHEENQRLQDQILIYQTINARLTHVDDEIAVLTELLDIQGRYSDYPTLGARIIARSTDNWTGTFIIDRGAGDGIAEDMVVLAPGGLAGRISKVGYNYAVVTPIIEDASRVSAQSRRTEDWGMIHGDINLSSSGLLLLRMEQIDQASDIAVGDEITTSNIASIYPPGILIGHVVEVGQLPNGMRSALVQPSVDFSRLTTVLVITELFTHELIGLETE